MLVSDLILFVAGVNQLKSSAQILILILSVGAGFLTYRLACGMRSDVGLALAVLVALMVWIEVWQGGQYIWIVVLTTVLGVSGGEGYRRLNFAHS